MAGPRALSAAQVAKAARGLAQDPPWAREFRKAYRPLSRYATLVARARMRGGDRRLARAARAMRAAPTPTGAVVAVGSPKVPDAVATVMGMHEGARTGWNEHSYTRPSPGTVVAVRALGGSARPQHPDWVGDNWTIATRGEGPREANDAWAEHEDDMADQFIDAGWSVVIRAFPPGSIT